MEWVNITAKTLPEAIDLALDNLGVDEAEAEIEVLEEPKQGLFGRTRGNARVRARVRPRTTRPKVERGRQRRRRGEGSEANGGKTPKSGPRRDGRAEGSDESDDSPKESVAADEGQAAGPESAPVRERSGQDRSNKQRKAKAAVEEAGMEEVRSHLEVFLGGLTEAFGFDDGVTVVDDGDDGLVAQVNGRHGLMVGPKARTLDAIQELARVSSQRTAPSSIRIKVDVGGYREMRAEALRKFAVEAAEAALGDGRERTLEPMNSADRKIVHDALSEMPGIETRSVGDDPRRRVVVVPAGDGDGNDESVGEVAGAAELAGAEGVGVEDTSAAGGDEVDVNAVDDERAEIDDEGDGHDEDGDKVEGAADSRIVTD